MQNYEIAGKEYPIIGYTTLKNGNGEVIQDAIPVLDIPQVSDYQWQLDCLNDRLEHPEKYAAFENVEERIAYLRKWLKEHEYKKEVKTA